MTQFLIDDAGWVQSVEVIRSPNFDARPDDARIKLIVVHGISLPPGDYGGGYIQEFFCNSLDPAAHSYFESICEMTVSAHCLIERDGKLLQFVSFLDRAWHAGESEWRGETACNNYSVGIELEGSDDQAYTGAQYPTPVPPSNGPGSISCWRIISSRSCSQSTRGMRRIAKKRSTRGGPVREIFPGFGFIY
jgi:AmpD protein